MSPGVRRSLVVAVLVAGFSRRSFPCGCIPTHPFGNTPAPIAAGAQARSLTRILLLRPSRRRGPSQSGSRPPARGGSKGYLRLASRREGLFFDSHEEGPIQPPPLRRPGLVCHNLFRGSPASPFRLRRRVGLHPRPGIDATAKGKGAAPFCRARAEGVLSTSPPPEVVVTADRRPRRVRCA